MYSFTTDGTKCYKMKKHDFSVCHNWLKTANATCTVIMDRHVCTRKQKIYFDTVVPQVCQQISAALNSHWLVLQMKKNLSHFKWQPTCLPGFFRGDQLTDDKNLQNGLTWIAFFCGEIIKK